MENSEQKMTSDEFERAVVAHGVDTALWPKDLQQAAKKFSATEEGKHVHDKARKLDRYMTYAKAELRGLHNEANRDAAVFLANLKTIPGQFEQQHITPFTVDGSGWTIGRLIERLLEPARLWSPAGLVSQGALASVLLFGGVMVGASAAGGEAYEDYDISAGLFDVSEQEYVIDG